MRINKCNNPEQQKKKGIINKLNIENKRHNILYSQNYLQNNLNINNNQNQSREKNKDILSSDESNIKPKISQYNKFKGNIINNDNNKKKDFSSISFDENIKINNKNIIKKNPKNIYNKILPHTPLKKEIKQYRMFNNKKNVYLPNSPSSPYLLPRDNSYKICPQKEINIEYNKKDIFTFNNNYYNNNFYKINNTQSKFFIGKDKKKENNFYHDIKYSNKNYKRGISPQSNYNYNLINSSLNYNDNDNNNENGFYNKTINNFYRNKKFVQSNNIEFINSRTNNNSINKYNNHKETKIVYTNKNKNNQNNNFFITLDEDNTEHSDIYKNKINNINNYKLKYINNSNKKKNVIRIFKNNEIMNNLNNNKEENMTPKKHIKKNYSVFMNEIIPYNIKNKSKDHSRNKNRHNNNLTEILDNHKIEKVISYQKPFYNNYQIIKTDYNNENENKNKILIKKRPLKEKSSSKNNLNEHTKIKYILNNKENNLIICNNNSFTYEKNNSNKLIFDNEDNIIEYINKKFEEEKQKTYFNRKIKFTGFVLTKKYKGKTLYDIRIEDDIDKINNKLKEENVCVSNELIQISPYDKSSNYNLEKEISKYKEENELLSKKDTMKNELIKKLDKEKQNIIDENKKLFNELEKMKSLNMNINEQYQKLKLKNIKLKNNEIENNINITIKNIKNKEIFDDKKLKAEINYTSKNSDNSNILSYGEIGNESKKNNFLRLSKISKISEIKENKIDNDSDSKDTIIKNNIALLNEKLNKNNIEEDLKENNEE